MNFEDRLRDALGTAVDHCNSGSTPDEACCKTACAYGFNSDQADRLVEVLNSAITINQYKHAADRTAAFPLAHKDKVAAMMLDADTVLGAKKGGEKKAHVYFEYMSPAVRHQPAAPVEKAASAPEAPQDGGIYGRMSVEDVADLAIREMRMRKSASKYAGSVAGSLHGQLVTDLYELADSVRRAGVEDYAIVKRAAPADIVERLDRVLPSEFSSVKAAEGFVDDTKVAELVGMAEAMHENYDFMKEMRRQEAVLAKEAEAMRAELEEACLGKRDVKEAGLGSILRIPYSSMVGGQPPSGILTGMAKDVAAPDGDGDPTPDEVAENTARSIMLQELLATDPVLSGMDPETVLSGYNTLLRVAPNVANDRELVRAILRQTAQSTAISPFDAEQWAKLDGRISGRKVEA